MAYTKLFSSIVTSTIWTEDDRTRIVWITMLACADRNGEVQASIPGLARIAGVPVEDCRAAIKKFMSPDADSRTKDDEGRRIEEIEGGWSLINYRKYREMASDEDRRIKAAERQQRARDRKSRNSHAGVTLKSRQIPQAEAEANAESEADALKNTSKCIKGADAQKPMGEHSTIELPLEKPAPRPKFVPPTIEQAMLHAAKIGIPESEGKKFWHYWESCGWKRKSGLMKSWPDSMQTWKSNYEEKRAPRRIEPDYRDNDIAGIEDLRKQWAEDAERVRREDEANGGFPPGWGPADDAKRAAEAAAAQAGAGQK